MGWDNFDAEATNFTGSTGEVGFELRVDGLPGGPAAGARELRFRLLELRVKLRLADAPANSPPETLVIASGPVALSVPAPQSPRPTFAGRFDVPAGLLLGVEAVVDDATVIEADGAVQPIDFGPQHADVGLLNFALPPGEPGVTISSEASAGWQLRLPAGANGALLQHQDGSYHMIPALGGSGVLAPAPFGFSETRLLVQYAEGATSQEIEVLEAQLGATTVWESATGTRAIQVQDNGWWMLLLKYQLLRASPHVALASLDPVLVTTGLDEAFADDYYFDQQDWMWDVRIAPAETGGGDYAWMFTEGSREVVIGFVDTGLDANHPELVNNLFVNVGEFPSDLVAACDLDPEAEGLDVVEVLDFDADGVFTLHDLNAEVADEGWRSDTLDLLDTCGYTLSTSASSAFEPVDLAAGLYQADDLFAVFADGIDDDGNGFIDDFFGANFRSADERCSNGTWTVGCDEWDIDPDEMCITSPCDETEGINHGTQMAGLAVAEGNNGRNISGVAMQARVLEARAGDGKFGLPWSILFEASDYLISMGAQVVVIPMGGAQPIPAECADDFSELVGAEFAARPDTLFVIPAGNDSVDCDDEDLLCFPAESTAGNVISVAASDHYEDDEPVSGVEAGEMSGKASFSNYGGDTIQLAAPGAMPLETLSHAFSDSSNPYWYYYTGATMDTAGTSAAVAIVGGAAVLRLSACGDPMDGAVLAAAIRGSAVDRSAELGCTDGCVVDGSFLDVAALVSSCGP